eukprot:PLAT15142.2.p1 GENE.PLAT15142.2~~PLAT15142.2.p1  ORF type:complete len:261 (+),score=107.81 PLAT15142.2:10-792(+)
MASSELAIATALNAVRGRVAAAAAAAGREATPTLVAVSKTKPVSALEEAYAAGQRVFGENYIVELVEKAETMADDIAWHYIGRIQRNKCKLLAGIPNLAMVETVASVRAADALNKAVAAAGDRVDRPDGLAIMVQVNTSGEASKDGVAPDDTLALVSHVVSDCDALRFTGLMTIGLSGDTSCFDRLADCRTLVCEALDLEEAAVGLSMGMSADFELAIAHGATNVRVGSTIFGKRDYSKKAAPPAADDDGGKADEGKEDA